jgi:pimeloyl-ACP methyl ester carboxylesterase
MMTARLHEAIATALGPEEELGVSYPGARAPDRRRDVVAHGVRLAVYEWGDAAAPPLALAHGGFDFARTFDVFAPLLADAGYRVVSWDQRGHGESQHTELYSWQADLRDLLAVMDSISPEPFPVIGHSKGGAMLVQAIDGLPQRFSRLVAIDGLPIQKPWPDLDELARTQMCREVCAWLDHRREGNGLERKGGSLDELARRRARMNPRLTLEWLRYLVRQGARRDPDGWRWKIDPSLRMVGVGPWRWISAIECLPRISIPMLALLCSEREPMGDWGLPAAEVEAHLPLGARTVLIPDTGHFIHIERPHDTAALVLDFLER